MDRHLIHIFTTQSICFTFSRELTSIYFLAMSNLFFQTGYTCQLISDLILELDGISNY